MRTHVDEARVEMVATRTARHAVLAALRAAHPYEEPAFDVFELADLGSDVDDALALALLLHLEDG